VRFIHHHRNKISINTNHCQSCTHEPPKRYHSAVPVCRKSKQGPIWIRVELQWSRLKLTYKIISSVTISWFHKNTRKQKIVFHSHETTCQYSLHIKCNCWIQCNVIYVKKRIWPWGKATPSIAGRKYFLAAGPRKHLEGPTQPGTCPGAARISLQATYRGVLKNTQACLNSLLRGVKSRSWGATKDTTTTRSHAYLQIYLTIELRKQIVQWYINEQYGIKCLFLRAKKLSIRLRTYSLPSFPAKELVLNMLK
jgi:hypothetical protein